MISQPICHRLSLTFLVAMSLIWGLIWLLLQSAPTATAAVLAVGGETCFVTINGSTVYSSTDAAAVQQAIDAASGGETIKIAGDCFGVETVNGNTQTVYISKTVTLVGGYANGSWNATPDPIANETVLDAASGGRVVYITNNAEVTLSYLTLRNGDAGSGFGGAINTESGTTLYLEQVHIKDSAANSGGAIFNFGAVSMNNSQLSGNTASAGGGAIYNYAAVTITNSSLVSNTTTGGDGGAIYSDSPLTIHNSTFSYNSAGGGNGGAIAATNPTPVIIEYSTFSHNNASSVGGTLHGNSYVTLTSSIIANTSNGADCVNRSLSNVIVDGGANLVEDGSCINALTSQSGDPLPG